MFSKYNTFYWKREKEEKCEKSERLVQWFHTCCPCWPFKRDSDDTALLTEDDEATNTPVRYRRTNRRASSQPYLSINTVNPVPNITLDRWDTIVSDSDDNDAHSSISKSRRSSRATSPRPSIDLGTLRLARQSRGISEPPLRRRSLVPPTKRDDYDVSSKSGTPSPMISRVGAAHLSATDLRDLREPSAARSLREGSTPRSLREGSAGTVASDGSGSLAAEFGGGDGGFDGAHGGKSSNGGSSLGTRSESLASIYSQGEGRYGTVNVRGEIELGYLYNTNTKTVDINIKQCKDLAPVDTKRNRSDPYVKVYLLPDRSKAAKRKTKVKKHTLNPVFDEILKFGLPSSEIGRRTMWVSVWHSDMFGRNDFLGEVLLPLAGQSMEDPTSKWFTLQDRSETPEDENGQTGRGDIILALKYVPAERKVVNDKKKRGTLVLIVKEAKNIPFNKHNTLPDTFCKCYLLPDRSARAKQKTSVCRRTTAPRWETTLAWEDVGDLETRALELTLWETDRMGHHEEMGGVRLNLGTGRAGGQTASWMDAQGREISIWQQMMDRQNFWVEASIPLRQLTHEQNRADK